MRHCQRTRGNHTHSNLRCGKIYLYTTRYILATFMWESHSLKSVDVVRFTCTQRVTYCQRTCRNHTHSNLRCGKIFLVHNASHTANVHVGITLNQIFDVVRFTCTQRVTYCQRTCGNHTQSNLRCGKIYLYTTRHILSTYMWESHSIKSSIW